MKLYDLISGGEFEYENEHYTLTKFVNGKAWCVREDGTICVLDQNIQVGDYSGVPSRHRWLSALI